MPRRAFILGLWLSLASVYAGTPRWKSAHLQQELAPAEPPQGWLAQAVARPGGLTSTQVARAAVETSPRLERATQELAAAEAALSEAYVAYFPRLLGAGHYARLSPIGPLSLGDVVVTPPGTQVGPIAPGTPLFNAPAAIPVLLNQTLVQGTVLLPLSEYLIHIPAVSSSASESRDAAELKTQVERLDIAHQARMTYYAWARARLQTIIAEQAMAQARTHRESAGRLFDVGNVSGADVGRVDAQLAASELFSGRAQRLEAVLVEQLKVLMHGAGGERASFEIGEDLRTPLPKAPLPTLEALLQQAVSGRAELKALDATVRAAESQAKAERSGYLPRVDLFADALYGNPNPRFFPPRDSFDATWDVGAQLSWSPNEVARSFHATDAAKARTRQAELKRQEFLDALRVEVKDASESVKEAELSIDSTTRGLTAAEESYRVRRELFLNGRATSNELTDAETDLTQARLNVVTARIDQRVARIRLSRAIAEEGSR